jgi:hypothetical protein
MSLFTPRHALLRGEKRIFMTTPGETGTGASERCDESVAGSLEGMVEDCGRTGDGVRNMADLF